MSSVDFHIDHPADGARVIRGRVDLPAGSGPFPYVLHVHGFGGSMLRAFFPELAERWRAAGIASVRFNLSCSGVGPDLDTFEDPEVFARGSYSRELEDIEAVRALIDAGRFPELDAQRGGLFGHSRGGGMVLLHAARRGDYRALIVWASIDQVLRFSPARQAEWRERGEIDVMHWGIGERVRLGPDALRDVEQNRAQLDICSACQRLQAPTLLVQGGRDPGVSVADARRLHAAFQAGVARLHLIAGAGHNFGASHPLRRVPDVLEEALKQTLDHGARHLRSSPGGPA